MSLLLGAAMPKPRRLCGPFGDRLHLGLTTRKDTLVGQLALTDGTVCDIAIYCQPGK